LLPKQDVEGSNPFTRSARYKGGACLTKMSVDNLLTKYSLNAKAEGLSQQTITHVKRAVGFFDQFLGGIPDVRKVSADDLRRFIVALQQKPRWAGGPQKSNGQSISGTSINTYCRAIKSFWSWLQRDGVIKTNPLASVPAPKLPKRLPKILTEEELRAVFKAADEDSWRSKVILEIFLDSGMRLGELVGVKMSDVDLKTGTIKVFGKGGKERVVFVSERTASDIFDYCLIYRGVFEEPDEGPLFLTEDGRPLTPGRCQKILERLGKRAELNKRLSPHKLRHTFATLSLKYGSNLEVLRRLMGHSDVKVTEVYLSLTDADVAMAHKKFSPVANLALRKTR
jgi:site-specific recombinase XerD